MDLPSIQGAIRADAAAAPWSFGLARQALDDVLQGTPRLTADVWVFSSDCRSVLLVRHPERGWVMPGGRLESGETHRAAAVRELAEETGVVLAADRMRPAALHLGPQAVSISYAVVIDGRPLLCPEPDRPADWHDLSQPWDSVYAHDRDRLIAHAPLLLAQSAS